MWAWAGQAREDVCQVTTYFDRFEPRRNAIYRDAAPLFAEYGYRGTTVRMLASSCGLSPSGLYHHFRSKLELALFPILGREALVARCRTILWADFPDPLVRLRVFMDQADDAGNFFLALRLAEDAGAQSMTEPVLRSIFRQGTATLAAIARDAAPALTPSRATEFGEAALAIALGPAVPGLRPSAASTRAQVIALAEAYLVPAGADRKSFEEVFGPAAS